MHVLFMNILFLTINFSGIEERGIYPDLMRHFVRKNHEVYVVSTNQRRDAKLPPFTQNKNFHSVKVRIPNITKTNVIEKGISTIMIEPLYKKYIKKYFNNIEFDLIIYPTPHITFGRVVSYVKKRDKAKTYLLLKDIFPQNAVDLGMLRRDGILHRYFKRKEEKIYRISDHIGTMSPANSQYIIEKSGVPAEKIEVNPNAIEPITINLSTREKNDIRAKYYIPTNKTVYVYGGNLGKPQGVDFLLDCVLSNEKNTDSFLLIVGNGTEFNRIQDFFVQHSIKNSKLLSSLPKNEYELLTHACDVGLIFLDYRFTIPNFPSRLLTYMQASMPVVAATDTSSDIGQVITEGEFGFWCASNDLNTFNRFLEKLNDKYLRREMGDNARKYLLDNYDVERTYETIMKHF